MHLPGKDLPRPLRTDHLPSAGGDQVLVDGQLWIVESVDVVDDAADSVSGIVLVAAPHDPGGATPIP